MTFCLLRHYRFLWTVTVSVFFLLPKHSAAATVPDGFAESVFASGLSSPTTMAFAPDGRLFIAEQGGDLRVVKNGTLLSTPFLSLNVEAYGERGLLGVAFDPDFTRNHFVYVYYTVPSSPPHNRVSRFTADETNEDVAAPNSEKAILDLESLNATNHNGGALHFAPDDTLYIAVGENANSANAQTLNNRLGKILRINPDGSIPSSNPFFTSATGENRAIWAWGLRNPYTFAFQPGTGQLFINDVGEHTWEEINDGVPGKNYGWPETEGYTNNPDYKSPFYAYQHAAGTGVCAITGGTFYNPSVLQFPRDYLNWYFFADYCAGWIKRIHPDNNATVTDFATDISFPVDLQVGPDGALYYLTRGSNQVRRVAYTQGTQNEAPTITTHPTNQQVTVGQAVTFSVSVTGTLTFQYQWRRNKTDILGATGSSYTRSGLGLEDDGAQFDCVVTNDFGTATSNPATLFVVGKANQPPVGTITAPTQETLYTAGQVINYLATATDPEDGSLLPSAFTWRVDFHHDTHVHPFLPETRGVTGGSFTVPTMGETSANVWYRVHLTVTDAAGLTHSSFQDVLPQKVTITLAANLAGVVLSLDGQPQLASFSVVAVVGMTRTLGAAPQQTVENQTRVFRSWSDDGSATHDITAPLTDTTYTATYDTPVSEAPTITKQPTSQQVTVGQFAAFGVTATGTATLRYQWRRNNTDIPGATGSSYTRKGIGLEDDGAQFDCVVTNEVGTATSNSATLTVKAAGKPPVGLITSPVVGTLYRGAQIISYQGTAKDPENGILPPSAFTWWVDFHHYSHSHPFLPEQHGVTGGTFIISTVGEPTVDVWYRIHLKVTDSAGNTHSSFRDVRPRTVLLSFVSNRPDVTIRLDKQLRKAPFSARAVVGTVRTVGAAPKLTVGNANYVLRWSTGRAATHTITVPAFSARSSANYFRQRTP